jgi:uncharacterized protein VirK/YbjX
VKSILARLPTVISATTAFVAAVRPSGGAHYGAFTKSICAGAAHLIRKVFSSNFLTVLSRFRASATDEPILAAIFGHMEIIRVLNHCGARALTSRFPNYSNKYITEYLAKSFDKNTRRNILKFHHRYLAAHVSDRFYEQILQSRSILWSETIDGACYSISMSFSAQWHSEGDISLTFDKDGVALYEVSFTIIPGQLAGCTAEQAVLVGRIQGRKGQAELIRAGTRACHDIAPPNLLVAGIESIAAVLGVHALAGVSNREQLAKSVYDMPGCYFDYDVFWQTFLIERRDAPIFTIQVPFPEKPIQQVSVTHRRRARNKRRLKKQIAESVGKTFAKTFLKTPLPLG